MSTLNILKNTGEHIHIVLILVTKDKIHSDKLNQLCEQFDGIQLNLEMVNYTNDDLCLKIEWNVIGQQLTGVSEEESGDG